jgi:hypothetical protein
VRAVLVVVLNAASQDANKLPATHDKQPVQALPPDRADPVGRRPGSLANAIAVLEQHGLANPEATPTPTSPSKTQGKLTISVDGSGWAAAHWDWWLLGVAAAC